MLVEDDENIAIGEVLERIVESSSSENNSNNTSKDQIELTKDISVSFTKTHDESSDKIRSVMMDVDRDLTNGGVMVDNEQLDHFKSNRMELPQVNSPNDGVLSDGEREKAENGHDNDNDSEFTDDILPAGEKHLTNEKPEPLSFLFEEEYNDNRESMSPEKHVEFIKHVIPDGYVPENGHKKIYIEGEEVEDEERNYVVEKILQKKLDAKGRALYLVKWEGFPSSANTWEPINNLIECDKKMEEFELSGALRLAKKYKSDEQQNGGSKNNKNANGNKSKQVSETKRRSIQGTSKYREYQIMDVMGMTQINDERYYLVSIANSTQKTFIRASLAKRVFPSKIIDFYVKNLKWKQKVETDVI